MEHAQRHRQFLMVSGAVFAYVVLNHLIWRHLYALSDSLTEWMQADQNDYIRMFMIIITSLGEEVAIVAIILWLWMVSPNKVQILKIIAMITTCSYIVAISKMVYVQPRPYQVKQVITSNDCPPDFGNPSGHSLVCLVFYAILFETIVFKKYRPDHLSTVQQHTYTPHNESYRDNHDLNRNLAEVDERELYEQLYPSALLTYQQERGVLVGLILLIGFSRIYLGAHSLNQVLLGFVLGAYTYYLYKLQFEKILENTFHTAIYKKFDSRLDFIKCNALAFFLYFAFTVQGIIVFYWRDTDEQLAKDEQIWTKNIQVEKCPDFDTNQLTFQGKLLRDSGAIFLTIDLYLCLLYCKGSYLPSTYPKQIRCSTQVIRMGSLIVLLAITLAPIVLLVAKTGGSNQIILNYIIEAHIAVGIIAITLIILTPFVYKLLRVDVPGDLMRAQGGALQGQFTLQELEVEL